jgi:hypothetical protein
MSLTLSPGQTNKFVLDEGIVLQSSGTTGIYFLDAAASYYYCIAERCNSDTDALALVEKEMGMDPVGLDHAKGLIGQWRDLGLLPGPRKSARRINDSPRLPKLCTAEPIPASVGDRALSLSILGKPIRVSCSSTEISQTIAAAFAHLVSPRSRSGLVRGFSFQLRRSGADWVLMGHGRTWWRGPSVEAVPALKAAMFSVAVDASPYLASIHAAGLGHGESSFLLAGGSGSGKTLLTLALVRIGYSYLSDDCVLFNPSFSAFGVPMPVSIKRSGIEIARKITPGIDHLSEHLRYDGHWVRYWTPNASLENRKLPVNAVFFIQHNAHGENQIGRLSVFAGLRRFAELLQIRRPLRSNELSTLVAWGKKTKFIQLEFSAQRFAMDSIASALSSGSVTAS